MSTDYMIRATAADNAIRAFAITSGRLAEEARRRHNTSPVVTAALGRLLSGAAMMGIMMKGENDLLTVQVIGNGPVKRITVTADSHGRVKGYPEVPDVLLPPKNGKLDVGGAVGAGTMRIIRDMGLKEPYVGQTELVSGEIAEDLTYYFATSEQVPSAVGLGVLMNRDNTVKQAGGFIIQLMPFADDSIVDALEQKIAAVSSVTDMLEAGHTPETLLESVLGDLGLEITEKIPAEFYCNCSKDRIKKALISLGKADLEDLINGGESIEVRCDMCNTAYRFEIQELEEIVSA